MNANVLTAEMDVKHKRHLEALEQRVLRLERDYQGLKMELERRFPSDAYEQHKYVNPFLRRKDTYWR